MPTWLKILLWTTLIIFSGGFVLQLRIARRLSAQPDTMKRCPNCLGEGNVNDYVCVVCDGSGEA